ncbi:phage portal protein [Streptomyces phaeolivaceus]|uniref:Phage portal protein n=1 Tax=Streptomyces phaeolivaceus TaxID=2653200 RepID=A0A5P8KCJ5_9ACTN|nr:phage portal protein [Streptomyces phaeolivaceus]QFR00727.1 phage portal protein [Streptomyces phaeolivaceus]
MPATLGQALQLVSLLESELIRRQAAIDEYNSYYRGKQPLKFASDDFAKFHGNRYKDFSDNWVQVVADSPVERLTVTGFQASGETTADKDLWEVWQVNGLDTDSQLGFLGAIVSGRSFVLVWGDPDDDEMPVVTFEDAAQCIVVYEPGSRVKRRAGLKRWQDGNMDYATLYLPDQLWKFERPLLKQSKSPQMADVDEAMRLWLPPGAEGRLRTWAPREEEVLREPNPQPNPMGLVPLVELPNRPMLANDPISDVAGVIAMQDAINLIWAQLFTASDYASFPQRVVLGAERPMIPKLNSAGEIVGRQPVELSKFAVDRVAWITGKDAKIAEWQAVNLAAYTQIVEVAVGHVAAQTRTPQHYLIGKMANLSGDALLAAETGLVKRCDEEKLWFGQGLREVSRLVYLARGEDAKARAMRAGTVLWADSESRSYAQLADALVKLKDIGFPFEWLALRYGLTPTEVADVVAMREREAEMDPIAAATQMLAQRRAPGEEGDVVEDEDQDADVEEGALV